MAELENVTSNQPSTLTTTASIPGSGNLRAILSIPAKILHNFEGSLFH
jgi:hypothetical protein